MKKTLPLIALFLMACMAFTSAPRAGAWELQPFGGYRFGGDFNNVPSSQITSLDIQSSASYGLTLGYAISDNFEIEGLWSRQDSEIRANFASDPSETHDVTVQYYEVGGLLLSGDDLDTKRGFFSFSLGGVNIAPDMFSSETFFTWSIGGGGKFYFNDWLGLRLQGRFMPTYINSSSSGYFCSIYGCWQTFNSNYLTQTEFTAGLIFRFGY